VNPAVYGIIGVVVGALVTGGIQLAIERRRDRTRVRASARLVMEEFAAATVALMGVRRTGVGNAVPARALLWSNSLWLENRGQLASALTAQEWTHVRNAAQAIVETRDKYNAKARAELRVVIDQPLMLSFVDLEHTMREGTRALTRTAGNPVPRWKRALEHLPGGSKFLDWYHDCELDRYRTELRELGYREPE
jgi:hypothetical protein